MNIPQPEKIIDLSANINPLGPPPILKEKWSSYFEKIVDYPDPNGNRLKELISSKENLPKESILLGNGGAELITLVGRLFSGKSVLIVQPTFSEYEKACRANGCHVVYHQFNESWELDMEALIEKLDKVDAVFLCNPNNPTGVCFSYESTRRIAEACNQKGVYLVIDEAFYDFPKNYQSLTPILNDFPTVIILRSMTKMFTIPGLRLGYLLASESIVKILSSFQPHWSVNALAMLVGEECLKDELFINQTIDYIGTEREKLFEFFTQEEFSFSPSETNFYILRDPQLDDQFPLFKFLLQHGVVPRHTMNFPGLEGKWLRFAIKSKSENDRLLELLKEWKQ